MDMDGKTVAGAWAGFTFLFVFALGIRPISEFDRVLDCFAWALIPAIIVGLLQGRQRSRGGR